MPFGLNTKNLTNAIAKNTAIRNTTVAPTGAPRQVRQGDYIVTYAPSGAVLSRTYSPLMSPTQNQTAGTIRRDTTSALNAGRSQAASVQALQDRYQPNNQQTTRGLFAGGSSGGGSQSVGAASVGSPETYGGGMGSVNPASGSSSTGGSGNSGYEDANSGIVYNGAFKGINDKQADYMVANPLAIAQKVFGIDMANNPTIAGLLSPILEAAQNPYIGAMLNPGQTGTPDQNNELNFAANLLKQYTTPGGSFLSPTAGLQGIQSAMGNPNSALNAVLSTATGEGAAGAASQYDLFTKLMAPFLSLGTGAWGSDIFDSVGYDAYNKYTLGQAATPGLPKQDFLSALMAAYGMPATLK